MLSKKDIQKGQEELQEKENWKRKTQSFERRSKYKKSRSLPCKCKAKLKYFFMYEHTIARMAKVLKVSQSGYFKWLKKKDAPLTEKEREDIRLTEEI